MSKRSVRSGLGAVLILGAAACGFGFEASPSIDPELGRIKVGAVICDEHNAAGTTPVYQCEADPKVCNKTTISVTLSLGVEGGVVVAGVNGGISLEVEVPTGCAGEGTMYEKSGCPQREGVAFVGSGTWLKTKYMTCPTHDRKTCKEKTGQITLSLPQDIINRLNDLVPGNPIPNNATFPYPCVDCVGDAATLIHPTCPGTNGGTTSYEVLSAGCVPSP